MFSLLTGVYDSYLAPTQLNLLVVGAPRVGKTTLLERLKVTQTPNRSRNTAQTPVEILTPALQEAFLQGGAEGTSMETNSEITGSDSDSTSIKALPVITPKPTPVMVVQKRRFKLSICPAPERYSRSAQDQEEEFVGQEDDDDDSKKNHEIREGASVDPSEEGQLTLPLKGSNAAEAPQRVRCHSKEFHVDQLDLGTSTNPSSNRMASMESIPLDDVIKPPAPINSLRQDRFEEFHVRPKAKMLPMAKIRPTSKYDFAMLHMVWRLAFSHALHESWNQLRKD